MRYKWGKVVTLVVTVCLLFSLSGCQNVSKLGDRTSDTETEIVVEKDTENGEAEEIKEEGTEAEGTEAEGTEVESTETEVDGTPGQGNGNGNGGNGGNGNGGNGKQQQQQKRYVVDYETVDETLGTEAFKYGVTRTGCKTTCYNVYNDGTKECTGESTYYTYDTSGYNATDDDLRAESDANCGAYMGYYQEVLNLVNAIRAEAGVEPLTLDTTLCCAASMRAIEMDYANYFAHARADGRECFSAIDYYGIGYWSAGENIAAGYSSPASVVEGWKNSPGHYQNMVSPSFTKLGVGYSAAGTGYGYNGYWVQLFTD